MTNTRTFKFVFLAVLMAILPLSGCEQPVEETNSEEPLPPSPEEVAQKIIGEAQLNGPIPPRGSSLPPSARQTILELLRRENNRLKGTEDGDSALVIVARKVDERLRQYERAELWEHVLTMTDAHLIFKPGSPMFNHTRDKALVELRKPRITVHGIPEFDGQKIAVLSIYLPLTSQTFNERMFVGEEIHGVRFLSVFGDSRGVRMEYLETGERFVAYLSAAM